MSQSIKIIQTLKKTLKSHGIKYVDVAKHFNISESSIKRQFTQGDISIRRLEKILLLVNLELSDLLELVHLESMQLEQLTLTQEKKIVSNTKLLLITISVMNNLSFNDIYQLYDFEESELIKLLLQLENINLIRLKPGNKIKTLISRTFQWQKNGPIQRYFETHIQDDFFDCQFVNAGELRIVINGMISNSSNQTIHKKMQQLAQNFNDLAYKDQNIGLQSRYGTTLVVALRPWELPEFAQYRRIENTKVFR